MEEVVPYYYLKDVVKSLCPRLRFNLGYKDEHTMVSTALLPSMPKRLRPQVEYERFHRTNIPKEVLAEIDLYKEWSTKYAPAYHVRRILKQSRPDLITIVVEKKKRNELVSLYFMSQTPELIPHFKALPMLRSTSPNSNFDRPLAASPIRRRSARQSRRRSASKSPVRSVIKSSVRSTRKSRRRSASKSPVRSVIKSPVRSVSKSPVRSSPSKRRCGGKRKACSRSSSPKRSKSPTRSPVVRRKSRSLSPQTTLKVNPTGRLPRDVCRILRNQCQPRDPVTKRYVKREPDYSDQNSFDVDISYQL